MMTASALNSLAAYVLISSFTPGPGNIMSLNAITRHGWRKGKSTILGVCVGYFAVQAICVMFIYELSQYAAPIMEALKYIGAAYLIWLAVRIIRSKPDFSGGESAPTFLSGFLLQFVNVKIYFYGMTVLSGYIIPYYAKLGEMAAAQCIFRTLQAHKRDIRCGAGALRREHAHIKIKTSSGVSGSIRAVFLIYIRTLLLCCEGTDSA